MQYAFRCKTCGHLHESGHAGCGKHPFKCSVCGAGCVFNHQKLAARAKQLFKEGKNQEGDEMLDQMAKCDPSAKDLVPDNWEHLADCTPERLTELGLTEADVEKHDHIAFKQRWEGGVGVVNTQPRNVGINLNEAPQSSDKVGAS